MTDLEDKCVSFENMKILLYTDVKNMKKLKERVAPYKSEVLLIKPAPLLGKFHLFVAIHKSIQQSFRKTLKTDKVMSEILYRLSPLTNVLEALQTFAVGDTDEHCVLVINDPTGFILKNKIMSVIEGRMLPIECISEFSDFSMIKQLFGITNDDISEKDVHQLAIGKLAIKDCL